MNDHEHIRTLLAAYCGGDLDHTRAAEVEQHLKTCATCRRELADLETSLRLIRTTPEVEAPPWLTARVMSRVKAQQAEKQGWLRRIFLPLHIKLPLEALALLMVCVTGYYVSRTVETGLMPATQQQVRDIPTPPVREQGPTAKDTRELPAATAPQSSQQPAPQPLAPKAVQLPAARPAPTAVPAPTTFAPPPPAFKQEPGGTTVGSVAEPVRVAPETDSSSRAGQNSTFTPSSKAAQGAPAAESSSRNKDAASEMKKSARGGLRNEAESLSAAPDGRAARVPSAPTLTQTTIRLSMTDPSSAPVALRESLVRSGATITDEADPRGRRIKARIPAERINELLSRLERLGRITERFAPQPGTRELEVTVQW